ncbi:TOG array regulator of axonemal microtubules protein 1-like [Orussus abietinus]|uniref:TOG array regulator of axonemal microtubules protein 1-like n=1 Tax=Orussus abietinus TaxID=222816 RepID=UPI000C71626E|nr:TOG array regulator of axonemal microtubules protein 1-like [Orussus abietinus]
MPQEAQISPELLEVENSEGSSSDEEFRSAERAEFDSHRERIPRNFAGNIFEDNESSEEDVADLGRDEKKRSASSSPSDFSTESNYPSRPSGESRKSDSARSKENHLKRSTSATEIWPRSDVTFESSVICAAESFASLEGHPVEMSNSIPLDEASLRSVVSSQSQKLIDTVDFEHLAASRTNSRASFHEDISRNADSSATLPNNIETSPRSSTSKSENQELPSSKEPTFTAFPFHITGVPENIHYESSETDDDTAMANIRVQDKPIETMEMQPKRLPSRILQNTPKARINSIRIPSLESTRNSDKLNERTSKQLLHDCFVQLESNDWEVALKGLKSLSQIVKQNPEQLDSCTPGTIGRLLGKQIKNLRSQVSRAACLAAGNIFSVQARGIDQDLDNITGALLHRTADTNRFLRVDCHAALDKMVEHLSPHRIIGIIVYRGASHQNPIVRATTARLLSDIVERVGPETAMTLQRDVRDKLLSTGAKLLIDGNLDARNHAKRMFRLLVRCEGFRKALTESVPDTTLRHIDKTLKSL